MNFTTHIRSSNNRPQFWKPVVLLLIFFLPIVASYLYLTSERAQVRKSVKRMILHGMTDDQLVSLQFARKDSAIAVQWKHSREFRYRNDMYDIVRTEILGDSIRFICWKDDKESQLEAQLHSLIDRTLGNHPPGKTTNHQLYKFYSTLFFSIHNIHFESYQSDTAYQDFLADIYFEPYVRTSDPPPRTYNSI